VDPTETEITAVAVDAPTAATVTAVVVSFSNPAATRTAVQSLLDQSRQVLEVRLIDNHPEARLTRSLAQDPLIVGLD